MSHHRESQRHPCRLVVRLVDGAQVRPAITADVSAAGLFVRTDEAWVPNALVRVHVFDPDDARPIPLLGIVTRCVARDVGAGPGIGVSLFGNGEGVVARWQGLVRRAGAASAGWTAALDAEAIDPVRRAHTRRLCALDAQVQGVAGRVINASEGGLFISVAELAPVGEIVALRVGVRDQTVAVDARVMRTQDSLDPLEKGVGVQVQPADTPRWASFMMHEVPLQRALPTFLPPLTTRPSGED